MQQRARIRYVPLIFCNHTYYSSREDDRDREEFDSYDTRMAVEEIISCLEGEPLEEVFFAFQSYWYKPEQSVNDGADWSVLIEEMVFRISKDKAILQEVHNFLQAKYIADFDFYIAKHERNRYKTALTWFRSSEFYGVYKILPDYFSRLGINTLYKLREEHDGFHVIDEPDIRQQNLIYILEDMARHIFIDLICYERLPKCGIIINKETPDEGFARVNQADIVEKNVIGLKVVNDIKEINRRKELFGRDSFPKAMTVYMHELLHQFGADASMAFRTAILAMNRRIMEKADELENYEREWIRSCE